MFRYSGASVSGVIAAPVEAIWEVVSDVARHPELAGSGEVRAVRVQGDGPLGPEAVFESQQCMRGINYVTANRVVIWDPPYRFAWRVGLPGMPGIAQTWMFDLQPTQGGSRVTNSVALIYALPTFPPFSRLRAWIGGGYAGSIVPTLHNLAQLLDVPPPTAISSISEPPAVLTALLPPAALVGGSAIATVAAGVAAARKVIRR